jgi:hypothetical protein
MLKINRDKFRQWSNLLAILAAFTTNVLANIKPINGLSIGVISNTFFRDVLIVPANYAFAIWGVIYLGLISLGIYQVLPTNSGHPRLRQMGYWLVISSLAQSLWVILFQLRFFPLSVLAMIAILLPLIVLYLRLDIALTPVSSQQRWLVNIPISIYLGWISVATIVNVALALYHLGWEGGGISPVAWTAILMVVGAALAWTICLQRSDLAYPGVLTWALVAIAVRHWEVLPLAGVGIGLAVFLLGLMGGKLLMSKHHRSDKD